MRARTLLAALLAVAGSGCFGPFPCDHAPASSPWFQASWQHGGNATALRAAIERVGWANVSTNGTSSYALAVNATSTLVATVDEPSGGTFRETRLVVTDWQARSPSDAAARAWLEGPLNATLQEATRAMGGPPDATQYHGGPVPCV